MIEPEGILTLLNSRSFGSIWFWATLLFAWTLVGRRVLGVPADVLGAAGRRADLPGDDPASLLLLDWLSLTLPRRREQDVHCAACVTVRRLRVDVPPARRKGWDCDDDVDQRLCRMDDSRHGAP